MSTLHPGDCTIVISEEMLDLIDIMGSCEADTIKGGFSSEVIFGFDGSDDINGRNGSDSIYGGAGDDSIKGGLGDDDLFGGSGNDNLFDTQGANMLDGGSGNDIIQVRTLFEDQTLKGGDGADQLIGTGSTAVLEGGTSNDKLEALGFVPKRNQILFVKGGNATLLGNQGDDWMTSDHFSMVTLDGGSGDDIISSINAGSSLILGGLGDDNLESVINNRSTFDTDDDQSLGIESILNGDDGDDRIVVSVDDSNTKNGKIQVTAKGGSGNDLISIKDKKAGTVLHKGSDYGIASVTIDGGSGTDRINISGSLNVSITTGLGSDTVEISVQQYRTILEGQRLIFTEGLQETVDSNPIFITDFMAGEAGDVLDFSDLLYNGTNFYDGLNPFTKGLISLVQSGTDTLIKFNPNRNNYDSKDSLVVAALQNVNLSTLSNSNFIPSFDPFEIPDLQDSNGDGFVDGASHYKILTEFGSVDLTNRRGTAFSEYTSGIWNATKAVQAKSGFSILINHERKSNTYKVWSTDSDGTVTSMSKWQTGDQMLSESFEDLFDLDLNGDSIIGKPPIQDLDGDGFVDGASNYQVFTVDNRELYLRNKIGRKIFSNDTSRQWDAIKAVATDSSIETLIEGTARKEGKYKIWTSSQSSGNLMSQTRWVTGDALTSDGYESFFNYDINDNGVIGA